MTGYQHRIRAAHLVEEINRIEHAFDRSAIRLIRERIAEVPVEVLDVNRIGFAETDDGVAGRVRRLRVNGEAVEGSLAPLPARPGETITVEARLEP